MAGVIVRTLDDLDVEEARSLGEIDEATKLLGRLDSLGLVTLIVDLEERLQDDLDVSVSLATERALSQRESPFRTVGTLAEYVLELVQDRDGG